MNLSRHDATSFARSCRLGSGADLTGPVVGAIDRERSGSSVKASHGRSREECSSLSQDAARLMVFKLVTAAAKTGGG